MFASSACILHSHPAHVLHIRIQRQLVPTFGMSMITSSTALPTSLNNITVCCCSIHARGAIHPSSFLNNMESLRRLMSQKENHHWETILIKWNVFVQSLVTREDWNPWIEWCRSWEIYEKCDSKPPKTDKKMEAVWRELYYLAKVTAQKLDEATAMRQQLKNQNAELLNLKQEATALRQQLENQNAELINFQQEATAMRQQLENQNAELKSLKEENLLLKTKCESLQNKFDYEQNIKVLDDHRHKQAQENEEYQRQTAEKENKILRAALQEQLTQIVELKGQISAFKGQLVEVKEKQEFSPKYILNQCYKKFTIVNYPAPKQLAIEGEESWSDKAKRAGVGCPSRYKLWKRLEKYEDPRLTVNNASYWQLVLRLDKYEDLETEERR